MERIGLFQEMNYVTIGDKYKSTANSAWCMKTVRLSCSFVIPQLSCATIVQSSTKKKPLSCHRWQLDLHDNCLYLSLNLSLLSLVLLIPIIRVHLFANNVRGKLTCVCSSISVCVCACKGRCVCVSVCVCVHARIVCVCVSLCEHVCVWVCVLLFGCTVTTFNTLLCQCKLVGYCTKTKQKVCLVGHVICVCTISVYVIVATRVIKWCATLLV